jgi:biopolymer transport protein ExbD
MSSRRKKRRRSSEEVELSLTAMLDMAFQLLTFFILTFKPAPVEGDLVLRLPLPMPTTKLANAEKLGSNENNTNPVQGLTSLVITVMNDQMGGIKTLVVGDQVVNGLGELDRKLAQLFGDKGTGFDQVLVQVGSGLNYEELMQVIDVCTRQKKADGTKLSNLSLVRLPDATGG